MFRSALLMTARCQLNNDYGKSDDPMAEYGRLSIHTGSKVIGERIAKPALGAGFLHYPKRVLGVER
jgi:hypothetical protein